MSTFISPGEPCKVINREDHNLVVGWDNIEYILQPGVEAILPAECAILWYGDSRSKEDIYSWKALNGTTGWVPDRASEVRRLRSLYANHTGDDTVVDPAPKVEVYTILGERITTVVDDPRGETINPADITISNERNLMQMIERQAAQLEQLRAQVNSGEAVITTESDLPTDESDDRQITPTKVQPKPDLAANE